MARSELVVRANSRRDKAPVLREIREQLEVLVRLGQDVNAFASFKSFEHAITLVTEIAKQNEGWLKSQGRGQARGSVLARSAGTSGGGDRVVHRVAVSAQERIFERRFIDDSYACRVGKGACFAK